MAQHLSKIQIKDPSNILWQGFTNAEIVHINEDSLFSRPWLF